MKARNYYVSGDKETLVRLRDEYALCGREARIIDGRLVVFALPQKKKKRGEDEPRSNKWSKRERNFGSARS